MSSASAVLATAFPPPERSARKSKGQGGERREEILEHAMQLFAHHGVHDVSTRRIAEAVGVSQPTLYAYFPTKDAILEEVCARAFDELRRRMVAIGQNRDAARRIEDMTRGYIRFGLEQPDAYRIAFMIEGLREHAPDRPKPGKDVFDMCRGCLREHLGADHPQLEIAAQSLWANMHGLVSLLLARPGFPWAEREALIDHHVGGVLAALPTPI